MITVRMEELPDAGTCISVTDTDSHDNTINPLTAKLFNLNFHPLEVVSR